MRLPNGYGSVFKLKGRRRKPWCARKTTGWKYTEDGKAYPIYHYVGYYSTKAEGLQALAEFNNDPVIYEKLTLLEAYNRFSVHGFDDLGSSTKTQYSCAWKKLKPLYDTDLKAINLPMLQSLLDSSKLSPYSYNHILTVLRKIYDYCIKYEWIAPDKRLYLDHVEIPKAAPSTLHKPFTREEEAELWASTTVISDMVLILIYTGLRIGEFIELQAEDVHLDERWLFVQRAKTSAGVREVPIAEKIAPLIEKYLSEDGAAFQYNGIPWSYITFKRHLEAITPHKIHDTRHTCVTWLVGAGVDQRIVKSIVGHAGASVTDIVYTHLDLPLKLEAINKL